MARKLIMEKEVPPKSAIAFELEKGQYLHIIDLKGQQVGDLVIFNKLNPKERFSNSWTRTRNFQIVQGVPQYPPPYKMTVGTKLFSTAMGVMAIVTADTPEPPGVHDLFGRLCHRSLYEMFGVKPRDGCWELLANALKDWGIAKEEIPDPINVFMNTRIDPGKGVWVIEEPVSRPGDYLEVRAEMDLLMGLTSCPDDVMTACNARKCTPLEVQIFVEAD